MTIIPMPSPGVERIKKRVLAAVATKWPTANGRRLIAIGRSEAGQPFTVISDPAFVRWQAEGAPSCGATWEEEAPFVCSECGEDIPEGTEFFDDDNNCYCRDCYPGEDDSDTDALWNFADAVLPF